MITNDAKHEAVADSSLKEEGVKLGDTIKDTASGKSFRIVGFTKNQSFSHAPVIHINLTEWKTIESTGAFNAVVLNMNEALKGIPGYQEEQGSLLMMVAFLFIIGAFVLAVFFYVMTLQKMNQFGVLKAIGAKTSYLARTILSQVVVLTLCSLAISIGLTYGVAAILPDSMPFHLDLSLIAGCSALFVAISVLSSLLSLYRVAKIDAVEAIGRAV
jgi:putative ABC transport system permease protein